MNPRGQTPAPLRRARVRLGPAGPLVSGLVLVAAALGLSGCSGIEPAAAGNGYEPAAVKEVEGSDVKLVTFTEDGADRVGLETAVVREDGSQLVVPYASLLYDGKGVPWVYTNPQTLTFLRSEVVVDRIEGDVVWLSEGPQPGTRVVTVGAAEVYGTELGIAGGK